MLDKSDQGTVWPHDPFLAQHVDLKRLQAIFGRHAGLVGTQDAGLEFSWKNLNEILASARLKPPRLRMAQQGADQQVLDAIVSVEIARRGVETTQLRLASFNDNLRNGATLVVDAVDEFDPDLRALVRAFSRTFHSRPQINLYACFGNDPGFGVHWDDHDVFILQLEGRKHWKIYEPTREHPGFMDFEDPEPLPEGAAPYIDQMVKAGEVLYMPRGHWHDVLGVGEPSLHLTLGITHPTSSDVLNWLAAEAKDDPKLRADLSLFDLEARAKQKSYLLRWVGERLSGTGLTDYLDHRASTLTYRAEPSLPWSVIGRLDDEARYRWTAIARPVIGASGTVEIVCDGERLAFASAAGPIIQALFDGKEGRLGDLAPIRVRHLPRSDIDALLLVLAEKAVISLS
jgi:Cupin superfamily protein